MIEKEYIHIGSCLRIARGELIELAGLGFVDAVDPRGALDMISVSVVDIMDERCIIVPFAVLPELTSANVNLSRLAMLAISVRLDKLPIKTESEKSDADRFKEIIDKMSDTYKRKNHDYGNAFSEMYDELGINYGYGKIREKVKRIKTLKDDEAQVANESLEDSLLDCANYCILTLMEYQKRKEHGTD